MLANLEEAAAHAKELIIRGSSENALELLSQKAKELVGAVRCSLFVVDEISQILWTKVSDGIGRIVISLDSGVVGETYANKKALIVNDPYNHPTFLPAIDKKSGFSTENILSVPVYDSKQKIIAIIQLLNKKSGKFDEHDLEKVSFFANYISGSLELLLAEEEERI